MATRLPVLTRKDLAQVFQDPRTLATFEALQRAIAQDIPTDLNELQQVNYIVTSADEVTPNAHVLTAGSGISINITPGTITISALAGPFGFGFDKDVGVAAPSAPFMEFASQIQFTLTAGLGNSVVKLTAAGTAPTATTVFDLQIGGVSVGSITFATGARVATLAMASDHTVAPGTTVQIVAPASLNGMTGRLFGSIVGVRG